MHSSFKERMRKKIFSRLCTTARQTMTSQSTSANNHAQTFIHRAKRASIATLKKKMKSEFQSLEPGSHLLNAKIIADFAFQKVNRWKKGLKSGSEGDGLSSFVKTVQQLHIGLLHVVCETPFSNDAVCEFDVVTHSDGKQGFAKYYRYDSEQQGGGRSSGFSPVWQEDGYLWTRITFVQSINSTVKLIKRTFDVSAVFRITEGTKAVSDRAMLEATKVPGFNLGISTGKKADKSFDPEPQKVHGKRRNKGKRRILSHGQDVDTAAVERLLMQPNIFSSGEAIELQMKLHNLLFGETNMEKRFSCLRKTKTSHGLENVEMVRITVSLDTPLLSQEQRDELNPMIITFEAVDNLPASPDNYETLQKFCQPVSLEYSIFGGSIQRVTSLETKRGPVATFNHSEFFLAGPGLNESSELKINVKVCDRKRKPGLHRADLYTYNENIGAKSLSKLSKNPLKEEQMPWDSHGEALVHLYPIEAGKTWCNLDFPVIPCRYRKDLSAVTALGEPVGSNPRYLGMYLEASTTLSVRARIAKSWHTQDRLPIKHAYKLKPPIQEKFFRIIYIFNDCHRETLDVIENVIDDMNQKSLGSLIEDENIMNINEYLLADRCQTLKYISGICYFDQEDYIVLLEGTHDVIQQMWNTIKRPVRASKESFRSLYNSDVGFDGTRLYTGVKLWKYHTQPLRKIEQKTQVFIK
eukprot:UC4_evm1s1377